jgi:hypothetical protein
VIFWIFIYYNTANQGRVVPQIDKWNYVDMEELAKLKSGTLAKEALFIKTITNSTSPYYIPPIP